MDAVKPNKHLSQGNCHIRNS